MIKEIEIMGKYVIKRQEVCAGILTLPLGIVDFNEYVVGTLITKNELEFLSYSYLRDISNKFIRSMLFSVEDNGLAKDLIFTTPTHYSIVDVSHSKDCYDEMQINNYIELDLLLKYLRFKEDLTLEDLSKIYPYVNNT